MVKARQLTPESLIRAIRAGDFYATSGVVLDDVRFDPTARTVDELKKLNLPAGVDITIKI